MTRKQTRAGHQFDNTDHMEHVIRTMKTQHTNTNYSLEPVHPSIRILKRLIGEVKNVDHLVTMKCSGKPWVLIFMWMLLEVHRPPEHCCRTCMIGLVPSQAMDAGTGKIWIQIDTFNTLCFSRHSWAVCCSLPTWNIVVVVEQANTFAATVFMWVENFKQLRHDLRFPSRALHLNMMINVIHFISYSF